MVFVWISNLITSRHLLFHTSFYFVIYFFSFLSFDLPYSFFFLYFIFSFILFLSISTFVSIAISRYYVSQCSFTFTISQIPLSQYFPFNSFCFISSSQLYIFPNQTFVTFLKNSLIFFLSVFVYLPFFTFAISPIPLSLSFHCIPFCFISSSHPLISPQNQTFSVNTFDETLVSNLTPKWINFLLVQTGYVYTNH